MNTKVIFTVHAAVIAALYVILSLFANTMGLSNFAIQVRFSEALTILPLFTPAAVPGLFVGCILSNFLTGCVLWDIALGSIATLLGALGTRTLRRHSKWLAPLPPIIANTVTIPLVLAYVYEFQGSLPYFITTVGIGEIISCGVLGIMLYNLLKRYKRDLFL